MNKFSSLVQVAILGGASVGRVEKWNTSCRTSKNGEQPHQAAVWGQLRHKEEEMLR